MNKLTFGLFMIASIAWGQSLPTTPNLGLQLIPDNYHDWGVPYRTTMTTLDNAANTYRGTWSGSTLYTVGQFVSYSGSIYISTLRNNLNNIPSGGTGWVQFASGGGGGAVSSVFGRTGAVTAQTNDYSFSQIAGTLNFATQGSGLVAIANGGTGTASPALVAGSNVTITGSWPNQTINASAPGTGTVTSFSAGTLSPLFTTSVATATTTPALSFTLSAAAANSVFGNFTGSSAAPTFSNAPVFSAANLTSFPTFNQNTTGNAATATALAATPTLCTTGNAPTGILANGNATGCAAIGGGSGISGLTANYIPLAGSATTITANSHLDDGVTTAATITSSEAVAAPSYSTSGTANGTIGITATGVSPGAAPASTIQIEAPSAVTAYRLQLPGAVATAGNTFLSCTAASPSVCSWAAAGSGSGTVTSVSFTGGLISVATATTTPALTVAGTSGGIPYFSSASTWASSGALTANVLTKGGGAGAAPTNSSITDNGTTVSTAEPVSIGTSPPACTAGTAGADCLAEGTAPTNVASSTARYADSTNHEIEVATNGTNNYGILERQQPGSISLTGQTAAITTATLCAAAAGACNVAGMYRIEFYVASSVSCATPGPGAVGITLTFTDSVGTKTAQVFPIDVNGATSITGTMGLGTTTASATGSQTIYSSGANAIQYATTYTACTTGTGTYAIRGVVTRVM